MLLQKIKLKCLANLIYRYDIKYNSDSHFVREKMDFTDLELPDDIDYSVPVLLFIEYEPVFIYKEPQWNIFICFAPKIREAYSDSFRQVWIESNINSRYIHVSSWRHQTSDSVPEAIKDKIVKLILNNKETYLKQIETWKEDYETRNQLLNKQKYGDNFGKEDC